ncbi:hypothetical protein [Croceicoccus gelatinilyticus]|uniref:hypothetical protein n=1 Tax=Croceicoccus gelatinilyticus TaxID=2835536 RepID=UPI001BCD4FC4|nr:hypothetical protein [Croceicoccus gelatinilyticus]MBS7669152.1 hypothetical protein [Croceicoccus gelatinilyticus]
MARITTPQPSGLMGTREEAMYRLKVGVGGLLMVLLIVAIASSILQTAQQADDPAGQMAQDEGNEPAKDPLVDIGVAPELPGEQTKPIIVPDLPAEQMPPEVIDEELPEPGQ